MIAGGRGAVPSHLKWAVKGPLQLAEPLRTALPLAPLAFVALSATLPERGPLGPFVVQEPPLIVIW